MIRRKIRTGIYDSYGEMKDSPETGKLKDAQLLSSEIEGKPGFHAPVLDIDYTTFVVPSSTEGHYHLFLEHEISQQNYMALLSVLAQVGLIEPGFSDFSQKRGYSAVRLPWIMKPKKIIEPSGIISIDGF